MNKEPLWVLVKRLRDERGLTQGQLAAFAGVTRAWLSRVELGDRERPDPDRLEAIAVVLRVPPETLLAAAGYRVTPLPEHRQSTDEIARELLARLQDSPIMVPETRQPASAGAGVLADAEQWPYFPPPGERSHRHIAVEVVGDCLVPRLYPGQRAIVNLDASPKPGDIVLAIHDGESLLKILEERTDGFHLVALQNRPARKVNGETRIIGVVRMYMGRP